MKKLFLIRHAKSSWKDHGMTDRDRPLNTRGKNDAPFMAGVLKNKNIKPDLILSSDALRARTTAEIFARILDYPKEEIILEFDLYLASTHDFLKQINSISNEVNCCFIFSHNPGISGLVYYLTGHEKIDMPTCAIYGIEFDIKSWREIKQGLGKGLMFEYPKKYLKD